MVTLSKALQAVGIWVPALLILAAVWPPALHLPQLWMVVSVSIEYSGEDDRRFRPNVTGDSAGSALLQFFTLVGHDQSTFGGRRLAFTWRLF